MPKRDAETLREVGEALYGASWQVPLSRDINVSDRTVRYWLEGREIPPGVWTDIGKLCAKRSAKLATWAKRLSGEGQ